MFTEELLADFSAFWLLAHASRFGTAETSSTDCPWERWRAAGQQAGVSVRGKLRYQVAEALRALGTGFVAHPANGSLRAALQNPDSGNDRQAFFEELLRLVYRLIFLATVEDRRDRGTGERLVFAPDAGNEANRLRTPRAQSPTVISVTGRRCSGTAWARDGHRMGTKQKATQLGGFRFAANSLI